MKLEAKMAEGETKSCPVNMTNHAYFNLAGHDSAERILDHSIQIFADHFTPNDSNSIPTKEVVNLESVPYNDFRQSKLMREALKNLGKS